MAFSFIQTTRCGYQVYGVFFRGETAPTSFDVRLFEPTPVPTVDTKNVSELTEIPAGNGYSPFTVERSSVGWPTWAEDDTNNWSTIQSKQVLWTPTGGGIPAAGGSGNFQFAGLSTNTGNLLAFLDYGAPQAFGSGQPIDITELLLRIIPNP